ncbi:hypothetical protein QVD17_21546 [Tagetes erecta]|uniref:Uncharacterized protein n=1 Tax=Tagetes erecta TaxID=13708 RepID=A0AAD8KC34_TARER|nr:hypothetical protein QVD17_21546 [Tagetes erecta]
MFVESVALSPDSRFLTDRDTLVSASGMFFELGFFQPDSTQNRYLGIWYKKIYVTKMRRVGKGLTGQVFV